MKILAHRGFWKEEREKNTEAALLRAFEHGYGIETDIRDYQGKLVISHNIADYACPLLETLLKAYKEKGYTTEVALNIKADGLQSMLMPLLQKYKINNYFLFDMSVPELVVYEREKFVFYTRQSDIEFPLLFDKASGVWLDSFYNSQWIQPQIIETLLSSNKKVCIVSPELHGYKYSGVWEMLKQQEYFKSDLISLCSDKPDLAEEFFYG